MNRSISKILGALCLLAGILAGADTLRAEEIRVVNTAGDFVTFMRHVNGRPAGERMFLWYRDYYRPNASLLRPILFPAGAKAKTLDKIKRELNRIFADYARSLALYERFRDDGRAEVEAMASLFVSRFPDARPGDDRYLILCGCPFFNGKADQIGKDQYLLISADTFFSIKSLRITLQHEMFHLHHMRCFLAAGNRFVERLFFPVLFEGAAVHYTMTVFPRVPLRAHLMVDDPDYARKCEGDLPKVLPALRDRLDRAGVDDWYDALFKVGGGGSKGLHDRTGYYVGREVVKRTTARIPLDRLIRLSSADMIAVARDGLDAMMAERGIR